jgi:hypothetical protein
MEELKMGYNEVFERADKAIEESKKLTTKDRKAMKSSTFCGPGKSFPINDCSHYTAGLRLLNRAKFSDTTKAKIKSCIMSKGKKMGCSNKSEKSSYLTLEMQSLYDSPEFAATKALIEESIKNPDMDLDFSTVQIED